MVPGTEASRRALATPVLAWPVSLGSNLPTRPLETFTGSDLFPRTAQPMSLEREGGWLSPLSRAWDNSPDQLWGTPWEAALRTKERRHFSGTESPPSRYKGFSLPSVSLSPETQQHFFSFSQDKETQTHFICVLTNTAFSSLDPVPPIPKPAASISGV